ncbi:MAG: 5-(carboxyamino)imidazole ribonucleotide mutase [Planctomycetes bacterium]|nr:5-(carboxyamino)imidazole ribonucleotide mutase [Planctomycetota bacterium]
MSAPVAVVMGSDSDLPVVRSCLETLDSLGVRYSVQVLSAHRTPKEFHRFAESLDESAVKVVIGFAGRAAHLAGVLASLTVRPVIAVPIESGTLQGVDALYSTLQMPSGVPVATMALGKAGAVNAAILAVQILALSDEGIHHRLFEHRRKMTDDVLEKNRRIQADFNSRGG